MMQNLIKLMNQSTCDDTRANLLDSRVHIEAVLKEHPELMILPKEIGAPIFAKLVQDRKRAHDEKKEEEPPKLSKELTEEEKEKNVLELKTMLSKALNGDLLSMVELAKDYSSDGGIVSKNLVEALRWFNEAASHGSADAMYELAKLHEAENKTEEAKVLYDRAACNGNSNAVVRIAQAHVMGKLGYKEDDDKAVELLQDEIKRCNSMVARQELGFIFSAVSSQMNIQQSIILLETVINETTNKNACFQLASQYMKKKKTKDAARVCRVAIRRNIDKARMENLLYNDVLNKKDHIEDHMERYRLMEEVKALKGKLDDTKQELKEKEASCCKSAELAQPEQVDLAAVTDASEDPVLEEEQETLDGDLYSE